jgi:hypothetical protein
VEYAPVVLFTYNRVRHTCSVLEALATNDLANNTDLICYSDGYKTNIDAPAVREVRAVLQRVNGFRSVTIIERDCNWGLADNIVDGVTTVVNKYGKTIVLEDDIVPCPFFLRYMNDALNRYADDAQVMHVSAYMVPVNPHGLQDSFFLRVTSCWGWGTWDRAWRHFRRDSHFFIDAFSMKDIRSFNLENSYNYWDQLLANHRGIVRTWAVFWYASVFLAKGYCLHPCKSLVINIGHDGSGTHCQKNPILQNDDGCPVSEFPLEIIENSAAMEGYKQYLLKTFQCARPNASYFLKLYQMICDCFRKLWK